MIRIAPDGARLDIDLPQEFGKPDWVCVTRISGVRVQRDFHVTAVGQYQVIQKKMMPGASKRVFARKGYDVHLYEAADRSDSCLVWVGPYHEATTWFGAAAPRSELLASLINSIHFEDSENGAQVRPSVPQMSQQHGTLVAAWSEWAFLCIRPAEEAAAVLPEWRGLVRDDQEIWRSDRGLEGAEGERLAGTAYQWRYVVAGPQTVTELTFHPPGSPLRPQVLSDDPDRRASAVLDGLRATWAG
ncbi:hypothetical protein ACLQ3F_01660 [Micromonospora sp. DT15]|uniref:hypothetical protein n=1 Tax=Micromonospora sp. DT15 TaxID=3393445 RepID=UPI003CF01C7F